MNKHCLDELVDPIFAQKLGGGQESKFFLS